MRSPNPSNANNARNVNTSGGLNNNNANNSNGVVPDCVTSIGQHRVGYTESRTFTQGAFIPSRKREYTSDVGVFRDIPTVNARKES